MPVGFELRDQTFLFPGPQRRWCVAGPADPVRPVRAVPPAQQLVAAGYYTTPQGMRDIGYVGNVPLAKYDGPPQEVLRKIGVIR